MSPPRTTTRRAGRTIWAVLGFLLLFTILVVIVSDFYLLPAMRAAQHATHEQRRAMKAAALLVMVVMLVILVCGLSLSFGLGRFFFPRRTPQPTRTQYVDAWAEAGRRAELDREFEYEPGDDEDGDAHRNDDEDAGPLRP